MTPQARYSVEPIGFVRSPRAVPDDDFWGRVTAVIELDDTQLTPEAVTGIGDFSHLEVIFRFHLCDPDEVLRGARPPRNRPDLAPVGVLAHRIKERPNNLGVSRCELVAVEGLRLHVRGLDAIDGTPVLDVKPFLSAMVPPAGAVREPAWVPDVMRSYYR
ncbi:tRNA (N6-threonylcarbamoyladenosine(37)-N6)-methyltransferase TrmO [Actinoplanes ianthinogenes]|uniref:tRNA (N6-threonylcarbamoyladenosine(37)-N6)-methyltransferase TrmO n=1 Tax=Actinoplanes ianthinogenes TaxID=122358 RepID=A0ABM7LXS4_9ACTN|nr:SAM-dependent methyltransferase [Actinoplanes ianthinogenes]BCJ44131.1 tRNA (N6-threonylcarbamoyladenosine(37)-N6)-methyltransferase TrmO [Actinoplanes ianthinogenes]GGQ95986.1 tRNA (N6-threonylcarbamoyladenosine(37)-N6)-methyltransferase TrmO [Actinoplanes ianthinogenes]